MTINERQIAYDLINKVSSLDLYGALCTNNFFDWRDDNTDTLADNGIVIHSGCSKGVIVSDLLPNWVIKFNLPCATDYCKLEYENYLSAKEEGFAEYFATTGKFDEVDNELVFYYQERADVDSDYIEDVFFTSMSNSFHRGEYSDLSDDEFIEEVYSAVCEQTETEALRAVFGEVPGLDDFFYDHGINDLHSGNFGVKSTGVIVCIDFSGF